jgi:hypothetical protein
VTVNLSTSVIFQYDGNGNLTNDGLRNFVYDDENELIQLSVSNAWKSQSSYDGKMRRRIRTEYTRQSGGWVQTNQAYYVYDGNLFSVSSVRSCSNSENQCRTLTFNKHVPGRPETIGTVQIALLASRKCVSTFRPRNSSTSGRPIKSIRPQEALCRF